MPRKRPKPCWRAERNSYFVQIGKKQVRLSLDESEAWRLYHELMARPPDAPKTIAVTARQSLVVEVIDEFLEWAKANSSPKTFAWRKENLQTFAKSIPRDLPVSELKPFHVTREINAHPTWGGDSRANFARCVQRAFRWANDQGLIEKNPVEKVEKPGKGRREEFYTLRGQNLRVFEGLEPERHQRPHR